MKSVLALLAGLVVGAAVAWFWPGRVAGRETATITRVADGAARALRAQGPLTAFAGRFVVPISLRQKPPGGAFTRRTLLVPATVRYQIDYGRMTSGAIDWDEAARTLSVRVPDIEIAAPQIDIAGIRELGAEGVAFAIADAGELMDAAARREVTSELMDEADSSSLRQMARDAARTEVTRALSLPLEAAGYRVRVIVRFPDELGTGL